jgi:hypothetical protein
MASQVSTSSAHAAEMSLPPLQSLKKILVDWGIDSIIDGGVEGMSPDLQARVVPSYSDEGGEALLTQFVSSTYSYTQL